MIPSTPEALARFHARVDRSAGTEACWPWIGEINHLRRGYGTYYPRRRVKWRAHRVALSIALGRPVAPTLDVLHSCDNPACCNPAHLREGTHNENMGDAVARGRHVNPVMHGEANGFAKLSNSDVAAIRARAAAGERGAALARAFGVGKSHVSRILRGASRADTQPSLFAREAAE